MIKRFQILLFCGVLGFAACDSPFATRKPEPPSNDQSTWIQPISPNYVLANLRNAVAEKNITNYMRCLADTSNSPLHYRFVADPGVANANPGVFENWGKDQEFNFLNQLLTFLPKDSTSSLSLQTLQENTLQDSVILLQEYDLTMQYQCQNDCVQKMAGQVEFRLVRSAEDLWYIYRWSDFSIGEQSTWSELKVRFGR